MAATEFGNQQFNSRIARQRASMRFSLMDMPSIEEVAGGCNGAPAGPSGTARQARAAYLAGKPRTLSLPMPVLSNSSAAGPSRAVVLKRANSELEIESAGAAKVDQTVERAVSFHETPHSDPEVPGAASEEPERQDLRLGSYDAFTADLAANLLSQGVDCSALFKDYMPTQPAAAAQKVEPSSGTERELSSEPRRSSLGGLTSKSTASLPPTWEIGNEAELERRESGVAQPAKPSNFVLQSPGTTSPAPQSRPTSYLANGSPGDEAQRSHPASSARQARLSASTASVARPKRYFSHTSTPYVGRDKGKASALPISRVCTRTPSPMVSSHGSTPATSVTGDVRSEDSTPRSSSAVSNEHWEEDGCAEDCDEEVQERVE